MTPENSTDRSRDGQLEALGNRTFDVLVLGGGISGTATAHELTRRGYSVALVDNADFASGTSQESSQLIWGGIKYMAQGHVKQSAGLCRDRNEFVRDYPDRVEPRRFVYPRFGHDPHALTTILAGAWFYWVLGRFYDKPPRWLSEERICRTVPLLRAEGFEAGMEYSEAQMAQSDARLSLDLLFDAMDAGLVAVNHLEMTDVRRGANGEHEIEFENKVGRVSSQGEPGQNVGASGGAKLTARARWVVNSTGVWVDAVNEQLGVEPPHHLIFSKGAHLVVPRIETSGKALTCLARDGRIFFVIPWGDTTLVGTTDTPVDGPPRRVHANAEDVDYLLGECRAKFNLDLGPGDVLNTKAGLRPLVRPRKMKGQDFLTLARSHKIWSDSRAGMTALWGGKFTDSMRMAEEIADTVGFAPGGSGRPPKACDPQIDADSRQLLAEGTREDWIEQACRAELVVELEDLLRRRTNIGLHVGHGGWGPDKENRPALTRLAAIIGRVTGRKGDEILARYETRADTTQAERGR